MARTLQMKQKTPASLKASGAEHQPETATVTEESSPGMGTWSILEDEETGMDLSSEVLAIHAALLHTGTAGQIIMFGGDEYKIFNQPPDNNVDHTRLFDCASGTVSGLPSPTSDVFCSGHAMLEDGRVLVAGGVSAYRPYGLRETWAFDPESMTWSPVAPMLPEPGKTTGGGRWYPTLLTLPDGRLLTAGGTGIEGDTRETNSSIEAYAPGPKTPSPGGSHSPGAWGFLGADDTTRNGRAYPRMHLLPNGDIFCASNLFSRDARPEESHRQFHAGAFRIDMRPAPKPWEPVGGTHWDGWDGTTVLLLDLTTDTGSPTYRARVLALGGETAYIIDPESDSTWRPTGERVLHDSPQRTNVSAVILPTGQVFVSGGVDSSGDHHDPDYDEFTQFSPVLAAELYAPDAAAGTWSELAAAEVVRTYHSVAMLMPDGRVWTAGSSKRETFSDQTVDASELRIEIFTPDYFNDPQRPVIDDWPASFSPGSTFEVRSTQDHPIKEVRLVRSGTSTHAFNSDQRCIELPFSIAGNGNLRVVAPPDNNVAPPGYYMLFLIDDRGVPSVGRFARCEKYLGERIYVASNDHLWKRGRIGPTTGNDWIEAGEAYNVVAMTVHGDSLYVVSDNKLWKRGVLGPGTGNVWKEAGEAYNVTAMASFGGDLYVVSDSKLWKRGAIGPGTGNDWSEAGEAYAVTAMASFGGDLYVASNSKLWKRGAIGPGTGNDWSEAGDAYNVVAMASFDGDLYVVSDSKLWKRGAIGPGTGNDWTEMGKAYSVTGMASLVR